METINNNKKKEVSNNKSFGRPKKDFSSLMESEYVKKWLKGVNSIQHRLSLLSRFCEFVEKTPDELIQEHHQDKQLDPIKQTEIAKKQLDAYFGYLTQNEDTKYQNDINDKVIDKAVKWSSARQYVYSKILSFYKRNKVPVEFNRGDIPKDRVEKASKKIWRQNGNVILRKGKKDILKLIYDVIDSVKNRAIFLCKKSSGLDDIDLFNLKYENFKGGYIENYKVCYIEGYREKTKVYFQTFFDSEACNALHAYFEYRKEHKKEDITNDSWLFVGSKRVNGEFTQMKPNLFYDNLKATCKILGVENITPKTLRRWFNSTIKKDLDAGDLEIAERMMGHKENISKKYEEILDNPLDFADWYIENIEEKTLILGLNGQRKIQAERMERIEKTNKNLIGQLADTNERLEKLEKYLIFENFDKSEIREIMLGTFMKRFKDMIPTEEEEKDLKKQISQEKETNNK